MAKEDLNKQYQEDLAYNSANSMFTDASDEMLGERHPGYFSKIDDVNGRKYQCHTFDNGHCYYMNPNTKKLMQFMPLSPDLFLHKYIETFTLNFLSQNGLAERIGAKPVAAFDEVTLAEGDVVHLHVELDRDEKTAFVANICLADLEMEKRLLAGIVRLCRFCAFLPYVGYAGDGLLAWLKGNGAEEEEDDDGTVLAVTEGTTLE